MADEERLRSSNNAATWADEFMATVDAGATVDWALMVGWFANAIEAGRAGGGSAWQLAEALRLTQEYLGSDMLPPVEGWSWYDALSDYYGEPFVPADQHPSPADDTADPAS